MYRPACGTLFGPLSSKEKNGERKKKKESGKRESPPFPPFGWFCVILTQYVELRTFWMSVTHKTYWYSTIYVFRLEEIMCKYFGILAYKAYTQLFGFQLVYIKNDVKIEKSGVPRLKNNIKIYNIYSIKYIYKSKTQKVVSHPICNVNYLNC